MPGGVSARPAPAAASLVERKSLIGFRAACERLWAPGLEAVARGLPPDVRERTAGMRPLAKWHDVGDLIAWHYAVWNGPAARDEKRMTPHIHATVNHGFGRVKRFLLSISTPSSLAPRVAALWRDEYSSGTLTATRLEPWSSQLTLADHPYVHDPLMRFVIAEVFRYVVSLTRTKLVTVTYGVREDGLVVVLRWE